MKAKHYARSRWIMYGCCVALLLWGRASEGDMLGPMGEDFRIGLDLTPERPPPSRPVPTAAEPAREIRADADERATLMRSIRRIQRLITEGDLERARAELTMDLRVYPDNFLLLNLAAILYTSLGAFDQADHYWEQVAALADDHHEVLSIRGGVLLRVGNIEQAEELLNRANTERPYRALTVFNLVFLYAATDRLEQAAPLLQAMSALDLAQIIEWMEYDHGTLLNALGAGPYRQIVALVLRGGEGVPRSVTTAPADGVLPLSLAGEDVSALFAQGAGECEQYMEGLAQRLNRANQVLARFANAIQNERWHEAAHIGTQTGVARLGLTASAFRAMAQYARFMTGEEGPAMQELQRLRQRAPESLFPALHMAEMLLMSARAEEALKALADMDVRYPRHALETVLRACAYAELRRPSAALQSLERLEVYSRAAVSRWFLSRAPFQRAILNDDAYAVWRDQYLVPE